MWKAASIAFHMFFFVLKRSCKHVYNLLLKLRGVVKMCQQDLHVDNRVFGYKHNTKKLIVFVYV